MEFVALWFLCSVVSAVIAGSRGLPWALYAFLGFIIGPFGLLIACVMPAPRVASGQSKTARLFVGEGFTLPNPRAAELRPACQRNRLTAQPVILKFLMVHDTVRTAAS
jgi:hypothetical protein